MQGKLMRTLIRFTGFLLIFAPVSVMWAQETEHEAAVAFFENYVALGHAFDPSVAELYSDTAKITANRVYPTGQKQSMELSGAQWKALIVKAMPIAEERNDKNEYSEIKVSEESGTYRISAKRYSLLKCYTDSDYFIVITKGSDGEFEIIEEQSNSQSESSC